MPTATASCERRRRRAVRGLREIEPVEAEVVRRIFREFAGGQSPRAIARGLNADAIPGPSGKAGATPQYVVTRRARPGFLRNEIYVGRQLWNKQTYVRGPDTANGWRVCASKRKISP